MHHGPDAVALVARHRHEVVARAERAELLYRALYLLRREVASRWVDGEPRSTGGGSSLVAPADTGRDGALDLRDEGIEINRQIGTREVGLDRHQPATDVDADGGGDDRVPRGDHRADGGADAEVGV